MEISLEPVQISLGSVRISGQLQKDTEKGAFPHIRALGFTGPVSSEVYHGTILIALPQVPTQTFRLFLDQSPSVKVILGLATS